MTVDFSINIGNIIALVGFLITLVTWGSSIKWEVHGIKEDQKQFEVSLKEINLKIDKFTETYIATKLLESQLGNVAQSLVTIERRLVILEQRPHLAGMRNIHRMNEE